DFFSDPRAQWLGIVGRRHPDLPLRQVQEELSVLARSADSRVPGRTTAVTVTDGSLLQDPDMRARAPVVLTLTLGTTVLLLILASVNVTTLLLSRAAAREREMAVRLSLGAGRFRLIRQLLTESLVLSGIALAASVAVAQRAPAALWYSITSAEPPIDLSPDWRVLLFALALGVAAGVMAGLSPAIESLRPGTAETLKGSSSAATAAPRRTRLRSVLVAVQIALSLLLVVEAALFARAHRRFFVYEPGFETRQVLTLSLASVLSGYAPPRAFYDDLAVRVNALPGVVRSSFASIAPWSGRNSVAIAEIDGVPIPKTGDYRRDPARRVVSAEYFATLDIPVVRGRAFNSDEARSQAPGRTVPTVVSEAMARHYWPGQDALGRSFRTSAVHEVVGIAADVQSVSYMQDDGPFFYAPLDPQRSKPPSMLVKVDGGVEPVITAVRDIVRQLDPQMAATVTTLASVIEEHGRRRQPLMVYGTTAGVLALLLALTGVYGVVSYMVSGRVREIGIRLALGARRGEVIRLIVRSGAVPVCGGLLIGLVLTVLASNVMSAALSGVNPRDPLTLAAGALVVLLCALAAIWIPARRAAALDPLALLRSE
ncbi:MAG TPA: FtsX-like permease family protein, partial [Vicinamibacterales bacterium]|nr:FtsX-like permease family protein [Vicinamibacterales bacterium]